MIWGCFMVGAAPDFYFKQLSQRDGLPQNSVRTIILDHKGFLWIGTKSGVSRFDYYEFKNYTAVPDSSNSLPGNLIHFIVEDAQNRIWISTDRGMCIYRREYDDFQPVYWNNKILQAHSYMLADDGLYLGGRGTIYRWDYEQGALDTVALQWKEPSRAFFNRMARWNER